MPSAVCRRAEEDRSDIDLLLLLLLGVVVPDDDFFFLADDVLYSSSGMRITKSSSDIPPIPPPQRFIFLVGREGNRSQQTSRNRHFFHYCSDPICCNRTIVGRTLLPGCFERVALSTNCVRREINNTTMGESIREKQTIISIREVFGGT